MIIAEFMYVGYHYIPLNFTVNLKSKKKKVFLKFRKRDVVSISRNKVGMAHGPPEVYSPVIRV